VKLSRLSGGSRILITVRQPNFDQLPQDHGSSRAGEEAGADVEDWGEVRRPRRSEGLPISQIARVLGSRGTRLGRR
jgi:hypothetical protein